MNSEKAKKRKRLRKRWSVVQVKSEQFERNMKNVLEIEKKNAVKEFAEKLKEKFDGYDATSYNGYEEGFHDLQEEIDELLKEYEQ